MNRDSMALLFGLSLLTGSDLAAQRLPTRFASAAPRFEVRSPIVFPLSNPSGVPRNPVRNCTAWHVLAGLGGAVGGAVAGGILVAPVLGFSQLDSGTRERDALIAMGIGAAIGATYLVLTTRCDG